MLQCSRDVGEFPDPLVDGTEADGTTKSKQEELGRLAEFGANETQDIPVALGQKRVTARWELDHRQDGISARSVEREFEGDETMYDVFAPSSTLSTGRIVAAWASRTKSVAWTHRLNGPFLETQPLHFGDCCENNRVAGDALEHAG